MVNVAYRISGNVFDAEDLVQEAFLKAFKKLKTYKGESTFGAWLKRIVVNEALGFLRKQKVVLEPLNAEIFAKEEEFEFESNLVIEDVMLAVNELPDGARVVFCLKAIEDYKLFEVANMLNISLSNTKVQYFRAKQLLREKLADKIYVD